MKKTVAPCIVVTVILLAFAVIAKAQQSKIPRVGILFMGGRDQPHLEAFKQGLREHGYSEGHNIIVEYRYAEGKYDRLLALAAELVTLKVDILVTHSTPGARAAKQATSTIPIVVGPVSEVTMAALVPTLLTRPAKLPG